MLIGARQVGKTYLVREFCKKEYGEYIEFNLSDRADIVNLFKENINTQKKIDRLQLLIGKHIDFKNTVLFFDEVQESEDAISMLKFFAESETDYKIICAGSLLGVKINRFKKSFPVGQVEKLHLYSMDFEEFLMAGNDELLIEEIRSCYEEGRAISASIHDLCLEQYRSYLCTGGMPAAVINFMENERDILRFNSNILTDIRTDYLSDMSKYINTPIENTRIEAVYKSLPSQLGNQSKKFKYSAVRKGAKSREYQSALDWLVASEMVACCSQVSLPSKPLKGFEKEGFFKLFMNDIGLLGNALGILFSDILLNSNLPYKGVIAENYVASQLVASGHPLFYWRSNSDAEIDFLIETPEGIIPIEVKAGDHKHSASLRSYTQKFNPPLSVRLTTRNFGMTNNIKSVPLYAAFCIK
jgi:predicted AAA+ superfamily ATPase